MKYLSLVLWLVLYPVAHQITVFLDAKKRKLDNEPDYSKEAKLFGNTINIGVWFSVGILIFVNS